MEPRQNATLRALAPATAPSIESETCIETAWETPKLDLDYYESIEYGELDRPVRLRGPKALTRLADVDETETPGGPLAPFFADELIVGEPTVVKSGKEASVFCCQSHPRLERALFAAKYYRPRTQRSFKNDGVYQQGRTTLNARADRAIATRTAKGMAMQFAMWIGCEYETLRRLHAAGADVPEPIAQAGSVILMEYFGDRGHVAPQLQNVRLEPFEVGPAYSRILDNLEIMLDQDRVHGDLSAYNVLYWQGKVQIIDFPQAVDPMDNPDAYSLFVRDLQRIYEYFAPYGVRCDTRQLARKMWIDCGRPAPSLRQERAL
ncbi:MAG TPA: RIO1 family regulatory kinase/ATPase [Chthonomonadaceae bacterium]|nr:RIO1 family regulatory kinase/ATPase [Chthonomonadaceae bacterium]